MALQASLYATVLATAFTASRIRPLSGRPRRLPWATMVALLVVGLPTLAQFTVAPWLLADLERDWGLILRGQIWRLFTSLVVQDGGVPGALFNLAALAVIGWAAEEVWGPGRWTVIALSTGLWAQLWGKFVQPVGGGNSVAVFGLAASLAVLAVQRGVRIQRLLGLISLLVVAALLVLKDIHGGAATFGAVLAFFLARTDTMLSARPEPADGDSRD